MLSASMSLRKPAVRKRQCMIKVNGEDQFRRLSPLQTLNFQLPGVPNNPCGSIEMLNIDKGIVLVDKRLKIIQRQSVLQIQKARFISAFLLNNARTALLFQNASPAFNNARSTSNEKSAFYRLKNARPPFYLSQNTRPAFLVLNAMAAFQHHARFAFQQSNTRPAFSIACLQDIKCQNVLTLWGSRLVLQMLPQ